MVFWTKIDICVNDGCLLFIFRQWWRDTRFKLTDFIISRDKLFRYEILVVWCGVDGACLKGIALGVDSEKRFGVVVEVPTDMEVCPECTLSSGYGEMVPVGADLQYLL